MVDRNSEAEVPSPAATLVFKDIEAEEETAIIES